MHSTGKSSFYFYAILTKNIKGFWIPVLILFMNTFIESDGTLLIRDPISKRGDKIIMITRMSLIIVVSACPMDLNPVGGQGITDLEIIVADSEEEMMRILN